MKIALVNNFPPYSGTGRVTYELFRAFQRLHLSAERCNFPEIDLYCTHYLRREDLSLPENRGVKFLHKFPYKDRENISRFLIYFVDPFRIPRRYDLYHLGNHMLGNYLYWLRPVVITVHDLLQFKYQETRGDSFSSKVYNTLLRMSLRALPRAQKIICVSNWTRQEVLRRFRLPEEKVVTIYNGINHALFRSGEKMEARQKLGLLLEAKIVLHVGAETKRKNIPVLLRALKDLLWRVNDIMLVRVGEEKEETRRLLDELGLTEKVKYFGNVAESQLPLYYQAADVTVLPSLDEGFGFPVLESLACGTPVVCSQAGPLPEIGGEAPLYFDPENEVELAKLLEKVLRFDALEYCTRQEMGFSQAQKFSWGKAAQETLAIYESLGV